VPIYFVVVRFLFAASIVVVERRRGVASLRRSWELVRGLGWKVLGNFLLISLVAGGIIFGILLIGGIVLSVALFSASSSGSFDAGTATAFFIAFFSLYAVIFVLWVPFLTAGIVLQYFDARVRKEGFNEGVLARELGQVPGAPTPP
jgi:Membrane domain of glycerophosphoryl diester phosphodiesterase